MQPPFTARQFLDVMARYNDAVWPAQIVFYVLAALLIYWAVRSSGGTDRWISVVLAFFWAWMGIVYHWVFFTDINPAARLFGGLFVIQALAFAVAAARASLSFRFAPDAYGIVGALLIGYALLVYPMLGALAGHGFPVGPTFGLPCPTTIVTFGLLLWAAGRVPWWLVVIPALWSLVGGSAAFQFGIPEDYGLVVAGVVGTVMIVARNRRHATAPAAA
jgi:hypothetical protein